MADKRTCFCQDCIDDYGEGGRDLSHAAYFRHRNGDLTSGQPHPNTLMQRLRIRTRALNTNAGAAAVVPPPPSPTYSIRSRVRSPISPLMDVEMSGGESSDEEEEENNVDMGDEVCVHYNSDGYFLTPPSRSLAHKLR